MWITMMRVVQPPTTTTTKGSMTRPQRLSAPAKKKEGRSLLHFLRAEASHHNKLIQSQEKMMTQQTERRMWRSSDEQLFHSL
jgi:hypothetical protein